ncbi:MAG TPA: PorP/SprF family type IX secretion system membrane protein, partial [Cytophagaceae bacterium]|nr:PorP/SprF family type IX secretion system membrane protein [Cytophagaceae bacterium]
MGQDVQLSQYYNAPLYLNPGFTGSGDNTRVGLNYRTQWRGIDKPFNTVSLWADHNIESYNSGIGLLYLRDEQGSSRLTTNEVSLLYSYSINVTDKWVVKPGIQVGMVARNANYASLLFADQLSANGNTGAATSDPVASDTKAKIYGDISAGGIAFNDNAWFGL